MALPRALAKTLIPGSDGLRIGKREHALQQPLLLTEWGCDPRREQISCVLHYNTLIQAEDCKLAQRILRESTRNLGSRDPVITQQHIALTESGISRDF